MQKQHPADKAITKPVYMEDGEFAMRTEPTKKDSEARCKSFIKEGLDSEYEVDCTLRIVANMLLYGWEITKEEYDKWAKPF